MKKSVCLLSVVLTSFSVFSPLAHAEYTNYGLGGSSCGEWVTQRSNGTWHDMGQWMLGFISAVGYYGVFNLKGIDSQAFAVWMDNYCKQNPLEDFDTGVKQLVDELRVVGKKP